MIKQFRCGRLTRQYLANIREILRMRDFGNDANVRIENGYILNKAVLSCSDIYSENWNFILEKNISINESLDIESGETIKFKLSSNIETAIDNLCLFMQEKLSMRVYRAFSVKLFLKRYLMILMSETKK